MSASAVSGEDRLALPVNEFCRKVSISRTLAYRLAAAGKLRLVKLGTRTVVPMVEVYRLLGGQADVPA
jgi:hypothetical protein